jgi:dienelactone hydrolase
MRPLEVTLTIGLLVAALVQLSVLSRSLRYTFVVLCAALAVLHLSREGAHWQMYPVYMGLILLMIGLLSDRNSPLKRGATASSVILLCLVGAGLSYAVPMFSFPKPTGAYPVGTRIMYMQDGSRKENAGSDHNRARELMVQIWYPSVSSNNHFAPYRRRTDSKFKNSYQSVLPTNSRLDSLIASEGSPFPVILFAHGWGGTRIQNTFLTEDLASHGYVVVSIDHTYTAGRVALPDGRVIDAIQGSPIIDLGTMSPHDTEAFWNRELEKWTTDQIYVLNQLEADNRDPQSFWYKHLDTNLVGAIGHSFGGSAALRICSVDPRVHSGINMDGWTFNGVRDRSADKPMMFMFEEDLDPRQEHLHSPNLGQRVDAQLNIIDNDLVMDSLRRFGGYRFTITGAMHVDFTDQPLISPFRRITHTGPIKPARVQTIVRDYALAFFDETLKKKQSLLLHSGNTSPFSEVQFTSFPVPIKENQEASKSGQALP